MLDVPLLPIGALARLLALVRARGEAAEQALARAGIAMALGDGADSNAYITAEVMIAALQAAAELVDDPGIGLELGLTLQPSWESAYGNALRGAGTVREACELGVRYLSPEVSPWRVHMFREGDSAVLQFDGNVALGSARTIAFECFLGAVLRVGELVHARSFVDSDLEVWADYAEPPYHARFVDSLPRIRYSCARMQVRHPVAWLDRRLTPARAGAAAAAEPRGRGAPSDAGRADQASQARQASQDWVARTRALLADPHNGYPDLDATARLLQVSSRTLRRNLHGQGMKFHELRDEARHARAIMLLPRAAMTIDAIARELGYGDATGFARAFHRWTGQSPSQYRKQQQLKMRGG